ncbi:hypothetical protein glysoja_048469 [Glycine soja]|uniref:Uncharacterized protein n=1 Tax=Glycine soja TaxID=3848 RepID=A0A0B2SA38_GLYSO|nr:hypothetical protein glysoja_048469 [Glycine soja]
MCDGFRDDSPRIMKDIEKARCQVCWILSRIVMLACIMMSPSAQEILIKTWSSH